MRPIGILYLPFLVFALLSCTPTETQAQEPGGTETTNNKQSIMLALLLDTSNSMDGLIDQAKSQLWTIVNELSKAKCNDGKAPNIQIALYEYGNDNLPMTEGYIRMVCPLTNDLDKISEKLFALKTNGGEEYCGQVIKTSLKQLNWSTSEADLKMIFIAGNEGFDQGGVSYKTSCALANEKDVIINTIFCGDYNEGVRTHWKDGALLTSGNYMCIQQDRKTVYVPTPYDSKIDSLNTRLNGTYLYYGAAGSASFSNQVEQDDNAASYGLSNKVSRSITKSSKTYEDATYKWDLVGAADKDSTVIGTANGDFLPEEMKSMDEKERTVYVNKKAKEREAIQKQIQEIAEKREVYLVENKSETNEESLDHVLIQSIQKNAKSKKILFD